jgi:hypothetical protein
MGGGQNMNLWEDDEISSPSITGVCRIVQIKSMCWKRSYIKFEKRILIWDENVSGKSNNKNVATFREHEIITFQETK